ncbi:hypothetical protein [Sorangium sp. So ce590]
MSKTADMENEVAWPANVLAGQPGWPANGAGQSVRSRTRLGEALHGTKDA